jgi:hypothetical protein
MSQYMYVTELVNTVASRVNRREEAWGRWSTMEWEKGGRGSAGAALEPSASEAVSVQSYVCYCTTPQT